MAIFLGEGLRFEILEREKESWRISGKSNFEREKSFFFEKKVRGGNAALRMLLHSH